MSREAFVLPRGSVYGNAVALVDTKPESLTNCEIAMSTDPVSEQESLYEMLFKVMGSDGDESELINSMKARCDF